jgi:hypothetical protein
LNNNYLYKNFDGYIIKTPKQRQKITIDAEAGFVFDLITDGRVFADYSPCIIKNNEIYSMSNFNDVTNYMIEEIYCGDPEVFDDVYIEISNTDTTFYDINYVAIKQIQISELDGEL